jgi:glycosyltransferase involved in cell wall biosynthesis
VRAVDLSHARTATRHDAAPFFSIVVCCWNSAQFIGQCVRSVLDQTFPSYEIVFVDGGSTDGTLEFIASVPAAKTVLNGVRGGITRAMNAGIAVTRGEVIAHLHADDYYFSGDVLERVHSVFRAHPATAWVFGKFKNDIDGRVMDPPYEFRRYSRHALLRRNIVPHPATFVRSHVFAEVGTFDPGYRLAMDYDMWLRIAARYDPVQIDEYLGVFRRHAGSSTSASRLQSFNEDFRARFRHGSVWHWPEFAARYLYRRAKDL